MRIDADHPEAHDAYASLAALLERHGGWLSPDLVVHQRGSDLWASTDGTADASDRLIWIPRPLLVPISGLSWHDEDELALRDDGGRLSPLQREILDAMLRLYRVTGKLAWSRRHLPAVALAAGDPLRVDLSRWCPHFDWPEGVAEAFLRTRRLPLKHDGQREPVLFPIGEILNHHPEGTRLRVEPEHGLRIRRAGPADDAQCYARYRSRDALDLLLGCGYAALQTRCALSLSLEIELAGLGRLRICRTSHRPAQDLPHVQYSPGQLSLSHLNFHCDKPGRSLALLRIVIGGLPLPPSRREALALEAHEALAAANLDAWRQLRQQALRVIADGHHLPVHGMLVEVAEHQQRLIGLAAAVA
ncbi:hypothetical protein D0B54_11660 [Solimonas sp. K1W22B-7]|uniref:hypothetical protein n=1 Tax=Solimonas sp. K1W22B-7 TaxID=2303331 RepID=UPI000E335D81|nr:hypothetical protein [Solimonas sp. K1W22B-7]AXQ29306.1 hypothetical protein D0B54_11660 [Solimonas sp. K1W22B-7]